MARTRRRTRRRRSGRSRRAGGDATWLIVALLVVAVFIAVRNAKDDDTATADPRASTTSTAPPAAPPSGSPAELLATLVVADEADRQGYEREVFGEGWLVDASGCDVRNVVLAEESRVPATRAPDGCTVDRGEWLSLYDDYSTPNPGELEIDHVVALAEAWDSGANVWAPDRREQYANDLDRPDALIAVTTATNQSKGDSDPAEWMPPNRSSWCRFATAWITQKAAWELTIDVAERDALRNVLATC